MSGIGMIDVNQIVASLMQAQKRKMYSLENDEKIENTKLAFFNSANQLFTAFQTSLNGLSKALTTGGLVATSNSASLSASVTSNTVIPGTHSISITQLAQAQSNLSGNFSSDTTALNLTGTLTFTSGSNTFNVSVTATNSLSDVMNAINAATGNFGVSASVVTTTSTSDNTTPQYVLMLNGDNTGSANQFTITGDIASSFSFTQPTSASNAIFYFDGMYEVRSSNTVTDVLDGLTLNLLAPTVAGQNATLTISQDNSNRNTAVLGAITDLMSKYNSIIQYLDNASLVEYEYQDKYDGKKKINSFTIPQVPFLKSVIQNVMGFTYTGTGDIKSMLNLGIVISPSEELARPLSKKIYVTNGSIQENTTIYDDNMDQLNYVINNDFDSVLNFFTDPTNGFIVSINNMISDEILDYDEGSIPNGEDFANQAIYQLEDEISDEEERLLSVQDRLFTQYSELNAKLTMFDTISKALDKQMAYIDTFGKN